MRHLAMLTLVAVFGISCGQPADDFRPDTLVALERGALDRWGKGDPGGYFDIMAPELTYFDPLTAKRVDGVEALKAYFAPFSGKIKIDKYEIVDPKVQRTGDLAVLSFNIVNESAQPDGSKKIGRWNVTEIYQRRDGSWKIVHSHFSYIQPKIVQA